MLDRKEVESLLPATIVAQRLNVPIDCLIQRIRRGSFPQPDYQIPNAKCTFDFWTSETVETYAKAWELTHGKGRGK